MFASFCFKIRVPVRTGNGLCCATTSRSVKKIPADAQLTVGTCTGVRMPAFTLPKSVGKLEQKGRAILTRDYIWGKTWATSRFTAIVIQLALYHHLWLFHLSRRIAERVKREVTASKDSNVNGHFFKMKKKKHPSSSTSYNQINSIITWVQYHLFCNIGVRTIGGLKI